MRSSIVRHWRRSGPGTDHDPELVLSQAQNLANGDALLGPFVKSITDSRAYTSGGLVIVV